MTVKRLLSLAAGYEMQENKCCDYLSGVGLCAREYIDREVDNTLSGGEMKRLEIATVLAKPHKLCIFDEPEAGIDLWSFSMLVKQFEKLHENKKESLIFDFPSGENHPDGGQDHGGQGRKSGSPGQTGKCFPDACE